MTILHPTRTFDALIPRYVERFRCIGAQCEDTCCRGWAVTIDKKTFKAYRQVRHPELQADIARSVAKQAGDAAPHDYARIALDAESRLCPMTREGLCSIQKNLNASYLSHTCFDFPRQTRDFGGQHEQALSLSCPEAARQALLSPDAFDFTESRITARAATVAKIVPAYGLSIESMNEVRILCLKLLRTNTLELWQRLAVLGLFCESLSKVLETGRHEQILPLVDETIALIEQGGVAAALKDVQADRRSQALVFAMFWSGASFVVNSEIQNSPLQDKVVMAIVRGLGADPTGVATAEHIVEGYAKGLARLPQALAAAPHLLEHFLLNEMFRGLFPSRGNSPYDAFLQLVSQFGLLRLMLAAQCNSGEALPDADTMVHTVHVFYRRFQHDPRFAQLHQALTNSGLGKLERVYGFLKT